MVADSPPPSYTEAQNNQENDQPPPPTYNETISRIKKQMPILTRSISVSAQKVGRRMSLKKISVVHVENGQISQASVSEVSSIKPVPKRVKQSISMIESRSRREESTVP